MTDEAVETLRRLASAAGVATGYHGMGGWVEVAPATLRLVLTELGFDVSDDGAVEHSLRAVQEQPWRELLPPTVVVRRGNTKQVPVHLPHGSSFEVQIHLEEGQSRAAAQVDRWVEPREIDGVLVGEATVELPADLPLGWHQLIARVSDGSEARSTLIVTPARLTGPMGDDGDRAWGLMHQIYALRSNDSWGIGDLHDAADLAAWAAREHGADFILVNPLHAAEPVPPMEDSPYLPATRRFVNPIYLRIEDIAEYSDLAGDAAARVRELATSAKASNRHERLDRDAVWAAKRAALQLIFDAGRSDSREAEFEAYCESEGVGLVDFATWAAISQIHGPKWNQWPDELQVASAAATEVFRAQHSSQVRFHEWLQWQLREQLATLQRRATEAGMSLGVIHDLAVGVSRGGADGWALGEALVKGMSIGSPPDQYSQLGQDWALPPWNPRELAERGYAPYRDMLRSVLRDAGGIRADHILGLYRLWWVPRGHPAVDGAYVAYDAEALIGILALEAQRAGAIVIGEDLGIVPPTLRADMADRGLFGTSILWFEWRDGRPLAPEDYRGLCLASVTTHDLPPTAGYLELAHVEVRHELGMLTRPLEEVRAEEERSVNTVIGLLRERGFLAPGASTAETVVALHRWLGQSPAQLIGVSVPDLVGDRRAVNQPGTDDEYPNWRVPVSDAQGRPMVLEEVMAGSLVGQIVAAVTRAT